MTGQETFQFAASIAAVVFGLGAVLLLAIMAFIGTWRLFRLAGDASLASTRAALSTEELARRLAGQPAQMEASAGEDQFAQLRQQSEALLEQQRQLQEMARNLLDTEVLEGGQAPAAVDDLVSAVSRLDTTVGQMAASLANLIQLVERPPEGR